MEVREYLDEVLELVGHNLIEVEQITNYNRCDEGEREVRER